jgi:hypothetical protein
MTKDKGEARLDTLLDVINDVLRSGGDVTLTVYHLHSADKHKLSDYLKRKAGKRGYPPQVTKELADGFLDEIREPLRETGLLGTLRFLGPDGTTVTKGISVSLPPERSVR